MEPDEVKKIMDKLPDEPTKKEENIVIKNMKNSEWMPEISSIMEESLDTMIDEDQDYPLLFFGTPGSGKSEFAMNLHTYQGWYLRTKHNLKHRFSLKNASWMGKDFVLMLKKPAEELAELIRIEGVEELRERWKGTIFWMDEAQDLSALEFLNTFNVAANKIIATIRALQLIYGMCIDIPTKLMPDLRQSRLKTAYYVMIDNERFKLGGRLRNKRAAFLYGRNKWINVASANNKDVRVSTLIPQRFIRRFRADVDEHIPPYPQGKFYTKYKIMKFRNMGRSTLREIGKIERKMGINQEPKVQMTEIKKPTFS